MDSTNRITGCAEVVGAAAPVTTISPALGAAYRSGAKTVDQLLVELADQFKRDATAIDPTITGFLICRDLRMEGRDPCGAVNGIVLERDHAPVHPGRKGGA